MEQVTKNVYVETGYRGCNPGFVVTSEGVIMIDTPQRPSDAVAWREIIQRHGPVRFLINTEPHGDHFTGNFFFDTVCVAQEGTRKAMTQADPAQMKERTRLIDPDGLSLMDGYQVRLPMVTFQETLKIHLGEHVFELLHTPGHTASETAVYIPREGVVFTGDNIFHQVQAFFHEALPLAWLESLETVRGLKADVLVPGHGEVCTPAYLDEQAAFIRDWIAAAKDAVAQGWSLEEAQGRISFLDRYTMGPGMEAFGPELMKMNVARLYGLAREGKL